MRLLFCAFSLASVIYAPLIRRKGKAGHVKLSETGAAGESTNTNDQATTPGRMTLDQYLQSRPVDTKDWTREESSRNSEDTGLQQKPTSLKDIPRGDIGKYTFVGGKIQRLPRTSILLNPEDTVHNVGLKRPAKQSALLKKSGPFEQAARQVSEFPDVGEAVVAENQQEFVLHNGKLYRQHWNQPVQPSPDADFDDFVRLRASNGNKRGEVPKMTGWPGEGAQNQFDSNFANFDN